MADEDEDKNPLLDTDLGTREYGRLMPGTDQADTDAEAKLLELLAEPEGTEITLVQDRGGILQQRDEFGLPPRDVSVYRNGSAPRITQQEKATFLRVFAETYDVSLACRAIGRTRAIMYLHKKSDKRFGELWEELKKPAFQGLEDEAHRRAMARSDLLMIFLLKSKGREVDRNLYQDRPSALGNLFGANGQPMRLTVEWGEGRDIPLERVEKEDGVKRITHTQTVDLQPDEFSVEVPDKDDDASTT